MSFSEFAAGAPQWPGDHPDWRSAAQALGPVDAARLANSDFAVAAQLSDGTTALAVDRFGQQTLCWSTRHGSMQVAPRADALGDASHLDMQALFDYCFFHVIPSPRTIFQGVQRVPAGHVVSSDGKAVQARAFGRLSFAPAKQPNFDALKAEFRTLLTAAVQRALARDSGGVPACFLSGGTDSSTVAGHIKQVAGQVHTYSIGFEAEGYDEMEYARIAAKHFGAKHHEYYVTPDDLVRSIAHVAQAYDQPFGNSSALPAYYCALRAKQDGVSQLLAGDGGDELFGGNTRYATQKVYAIWDKVPGIIRNALIKPVLGLPGTSGMELFRRGRNYVRDAERGLPDRLQYYNQILRIGAGTIFEPGFLAQVDADSVFRQQRDVWALAQATNDLDRQLAFDWRYTLAENDLPKVRGTGTLAGVRVAYPMLDDDLVDFSMRLPEDFKVKGRYLRWFFKQALLDFLPEAIITKEKKGFGLPFGVWATRHAALRELAEDSVRGFGTRGVIRPQFADELVRTRLYEHPGYYGEMIWILMMLEQWLRGHAPNWRVAA